MGQNASACKTLDQTEVDYLRTSTDLQESEIRSLHEEFVKKNKISRKEFLAGFKKAFPNAMDPDAVAKRIFEVYDTDHDGCISFREFVLSLFIMTRAPKEDKLRKMFSILDENGSGFLSSQEVVTAVKRAYDILGKLNCDYNGKGIAIFRQFDVDGDLKISEREFVDGCLRDHELCTMLEGSIGAFAGPVAAAGFNLPDQ